jgi:hypothetical protein
LYYPSGGASFHRTAAFFTVILSEAKDLLPVG